MINTRNKLRAGWLGAAAILTGLAATPLAAQPIEKTAFDLPAQDLNAMLRAIARASGREIIFVSETVRGRTAARLHGRLTLDEALRLVLAGTGLVAELRDKAILIRQGGPSDAAATPNEDNVSVTVTGTRIRGARSASPVIVATRRALEDAGVTDLGGFSRILPQNFTGGQNPGVAGGGQQGGQNNVNNSTTLNLRGLGPDATLTLVNGHRVAYDALNQGVDISAIPLAAIERVEVIADGASALYGSDAVGGVANIILRRDYEGAQLTARFGGALDGGNEQQQYSAVTGGRWRSGGVMAALDYNRSSPILAGDRAYTSDLDESATLIARQSQFSAVLAGHQRLGDAVTFEVDAQFSDRRSQKSNAFFTSSDVFTNGLFNRPQVRSYSVTPIVRIALPAEWEAALSMTRGVSRTNIASRRFFNAIETPQRLIYENRFTGFEANADGPLFRLPGGDVRLALGGGVRSALLDVDVSRLVGGARITTRKFTEARDSQFAFGELSIPLVGPDNRLPLVERLKLSAALRYERYEEMDEVATPKFGLVYQPHRDMTLSATWGQSFKVPTLEQVNQILGANLYPGSSFVPQPTPPLPPGATVIVLDGGNPALRSERATTWTATLEFRPAFLEGLRVEASYYDIDYRDRIAAPVSGIFAALANPAYRDLILFNPTVQQVEDIVARLAQGLVNETGEPFDPAMTAAILDGALRNAARERAHGVDLAADYRLEFGPDSRLLLIASASYLESERQLSDGLPVLQRAGLIFNPPHWRGRAGGTFDRANLSLSGFLNYVGGTLDNRFIDLARIGAFVTLDLSARLRLSAGKGLLRDLELRLSALNLLDEQPDFIRNSDPAAPPYDSTNQSPVGRFVSLSVTKTW